MSNSAQPVQGLGAWVSDTLEDNGHHRSLLAYWELWVDPQAGHVGGLPGLWIKTGCSGPDSSSRTELKARLSSKSLTLFLLNEGGGNWTRMARSV